METPMSHHGAARPEVKNSAVFFPARRAKKRAGKKQTTTEATTISQSRVVRCIGPSFQASFGDSLNFFGREYKTGTGGGPAKRGKAAA